ncbi:Aldo/keto reductase [Rhodocollybia butyracea]|uniref:Aldo/keto reductase n=1 Tax=Rhodocollybia butyracea TaxID=206335 RepID=A0A9P5PXR3_9AGAR|nr:Aldo/keto reductase [Rhodocollybia butyracea]
MSSQPVQKSQLNVVLGAMTFGRENTMGARVHDVKDIESILDAFVAHGHTEVDTSRTYCLGTSEEYLGQIDWKSKGIKMETKLIAMNIDFETAPATYVAFMKQLSDEKITHTYEDMKKHILRSLKALKTDQLEMWYLHSPDRKTDYAVTMKAVNDLYKEGYFKKFGISNYMAWEVAEIVQICIANEFIRPSVYQGIYNAIHRNAEPELFPCLRKYGISFYEFNPLGGGFFTGRYTSLEDQVEPGSRFDAGLPQGQIYRGRYWNEPHFQALTSVQAVANAHNLTMAEIALRWVSHHSLITHEHGDSILIGTSNLKHIEQNLVDLEKGPLPDEVVEALDAAWQSVKPYSSTYHH